LISINLFLNLTGFYNDFRWLRIINSFLFFRLPRPPFILTITIWKNQIRRSARLPFIFWLGPENEPKEPKTLPST